MTTMLMSMVPLFWVGCSNTVHPNTLEGAGGRQQIVVSEECRVADFTVLGSEHIIEEIKENFVVREVRGRIVSDSGEWPPDGVLFELKRLDQKELKSTHSDIDGFFSMSGVGPGSYCFKAAVDGWQSVIGIVVVDERAADDVTIDFEMLLGV
jgi:hypothetical protein